MDPDTCLQDILTPGITKSAMLEKLKNLDTWLMSGGFLPKRWSNAEPQKEYKPCFCGNPKAKGYHAYRGCTLH